MRLAALALALAALQDRPKDPATTKEAMQRLQILVGEWRCTGQPNEMKRDPWTEKMNWGYKIDKDLYRLELKGTDAVFWSEALVSYDLKEKLYVVEASRVDAGKKTYKGKLDESDAKNRRLLVEEATEEWPRERVMFKLLRENRWLMIVEKQEGKGKDWVELGLLGCTKEGVPFVKGRQPECIITGGGAAIAVEYKGKTYYVC
jgi:hypothetical protein